MMRALLVDDESPARSELRYLLGESTRTSRSSGEAASAQEALTLARDSRYDVVFLDVEMPGLTGVEAAPLVRERREPPARRLRHGARALCGRGVRGRGVRLPAQARRPGAARTRRSSACANGRPRTRCPSRRSRSSPAAAPSCSTSTRCTTRRPTATTAACTPTTAPTSVLRRSASSRSGSGRASRASIARTSSTSARSQASAAPRRTGSACSSRDADKTELDVARRQSRQLRERLGL